MTIFKDEKISRYITNLWTILFILFIIIDFFSKSNYEFLIGPFSAIYIGVLSLYAGTKEFDRWYELHEGRHPGEWFVLGWTATILVLFVFYFIFQKAYKVHSEVIADYIAVLSIFALTQKSKKMHERRGRRKN